MSNSCYLYPRHFFIFAIISVLVCVSVSAEIPNKQVEKIQRFDPTNQRINELQVAGPAQPDFRKPVTSLKPIPDNLSVPSAALNYFCDIVDYTSGVAGYYWTIPDAYGDDLFNMRFTSESDFDCSLKVAHYLLYYPEMAETDIRCYLWDDDGFGFPGAKLDSVDISWAEIETAHTAASSNLFYVSADFTFGGTIDYVFSDGVEYHLGLTALNQTTGAVSIVSDYGAGSYAGEERASEFYSGQWGTMLNDWGDDVSFFILAETCCSEIPLTDCYSINPISNLSYFWRAPHPSFGDVAYAQRFQVTGPDTLKSVDIAIYDDAASSTSIDPAGNNNITISVYADDGSGLPDPTVLLAQETLLAGTYPFYPSLVSVPIDYVFDGSMHEYHIAFSTDGVEGVSYESCMSSNGDDGSNLSSSDWGGGNWVDMLSGWGLDVNFYFVPNICVDPNTMCYWRQNATYLAYFWRLPDRYGDNGHAQKFEISSDGCRVEEIVFDLYWRKDENTANGWHKYEDSCKVAVYADLQGHPGAELASIMVGPGDYQISESTPTVSTFGTLTVDFRPFNVIVTNDYWVSIETQIYDTLRGVYTLTDDGYSDGPDYGLVETWGDWDTNWGYQCGGNWPPPCNIALRVNSRQCCIPPIPTYCQSYLDDGWATYQGDYARTGRSNLSVGESKCDLNLDWSYEHPSEGISFTGPTIWQDKVIQGYNSEYHVLDLSSGSLLYTIDQTTSGSPLNWSSIRNSGTVHHINSLNKDVLFITGGSAQGIYAYDINTGTVLWHLDPSNGGPIAGQTRWGTFVVLDMGGFDVLFYGTDNGNILAVEAATGLLYTGWVTNPVNLGYSTFKSGASDGTYLYFGTYATAGEGDIYAINPVNGSILWQLSSTGGLQASNYFGSNYTGGEEGFESVSYDYHTGNLFANSRCEGDYPTDGLMYSLSGYTGNLNAVTLSNRAQRASPIIDVNRIYMPTFSRWVDPPLGGNIIAFNKNTLDPYFVTSSASEGRYYTDGLLTCGEIGNQSELFLFNEDGFLSSFNADDGTENYRRRIFHAPGYIPNVGMAGAIAQDPFDDKVHLLFADFWGTLYDFNKGVERPRLQFNTYNPEASIDFGPSTSVVVDIGSFITNSGCTDLTIESITIDELPFAPDLPSFSTKYLSEETIQKTNSLATLLTSSSSDKLGKILDEKIIPTDAFYTLRQSSKELTNSSASGIPSFVNSIITPFVGQVIAPSEEINLIVDINQSAIFRGPQSFYIEIGSDDPDFFINDPTIKPQAKVTINGGCITDTTTLEFGVGGANLQLVTNSGRLGTGDWDPHGFVIDGNQSAYYQGTYLYQASTHRVAANSQDWKGGGGEADAIKSLQADPNYCNSLCKPALITTVSLGAYWNGTFYQPIVGNLVCATFIDSVQNFDLGSGWDWENFSAPFDNDSTIGLTVNQRTIGVLDFPPLANLTLAIMTFTERNGNDIPGWFLSSIHDHDVGNDNGNADPSNSVAWAYDMSGDGAWGQMKIPFGLCDGPGLINAHGLNGPASLWEWFPYWDSTYIFANAGNGYFDHNMTDGDGELHITLASHDFLPNEEYTVGVVNFGLQGLNDNSSSEEFAVISNLVNKWAGFGRGDVNNDTRIDLADIIYLAAYLNGEGPGPVPFYHLGDLNCNAEIDLDDINYLIDFYFNCGVCPCGEWEI